MRHPTDRIIHTTAFVTPVVEHWLEREIAQWVHPMKNRSDDPLHYTHLKLKTRLLMELFFVTGKCFRSRPLDTTSLINCYQLLSGVILIRPRE